MGDQLIGMDAPAHQMLYQFLHAPQRGDPGSADGLLAVHDIRGRIEGHVISLADHHHFSPFPGAADGQRTGGRIAGAVCRTLTAKTARHFHDLCLACLRIRRIEYIVGKAEILRQLHALLVDIGADGHIAAHGFRKHQRRQSHRTQAGDQHTVIARDTDLHQSLVDCAEAAGSLCAVFIGQLVRQRDQILLVTQNIGSHSAIALPAVCRAERALAGDVITAPAVIANAAAGNVIHDDAVAFLEALQAFPLDLNNAAGFVAGDHARLIALRSLAQMSPVNGADVRSADGRSFGLYHDLSVARGGHVKFLYLHGAVARKNRAPHLDFHDHTSIFAGCPAVHQQYILSLSWRLDAAVTCFC